MSYTMRCNILDLPAELELEIIEELLEDIEVDTVEDYNRKEMQDEPIKIYKDLISWSSTCSHFRHFLAPFIFNTVQLVNDEKSGSSLTALAKSPHHVYVKSLHFIGSALGDAHSKEAAFSDIEGILPRSVHALLCDLQQFPSLERLSVKFDYNFENLEEWPDGVDLDVESETPEQVLEAEASAAWRALMSRTYFALIQNKPPHFKHLEIRQLIWKSVSTFGHAAFHDFLGHFEQFTLSIHGEVIAEQWKSNMTQDYSALMGRLNHYFFNHLANVTNLFIKAPEEGPLGLNGYSALPHIPLTLEADQMSLVTTLHLEYVFASPELIDFLVGHKNILEQLTLRNCYASTGECSFAENGVYWSKLFTDLFFASPTQLRHFELDGREMPLPSEKDFDEEGNEQVRIILEQDPGRKLFPYGSMDDDFGVLFYDDGETLMCFLEGDDQWAWDQLMGLVESNARAFAKNKSKGGKLQSQSEMKRLLLCKAG